MKRITAICCILMVLLLLSYCMLHESLERWETNNSGNLKEPDVFLSFLEDNRILYYVSSEEGVKFCIWDGNDCYEEIGEIKNYYLDTGVTALLDGHVYLCSTLTDEGGESYNSLCDIDMDLKCVRVLDKDYDSLPGVSVYSVGERIISLKSISKGDELITYFEAYSPKTKKTERILERIFNEEKQIGKVLYVMSVDEDEHIYVIEDAYTEKGECSHFLIQYNKAFEELKRAELKGECKSFIDNVENRIVELKVMDDYIYVRDLSSNGFLGSVSGSMESIEEEELMPILSSYNTRELGFYKRGSDIAYFLDRDSKQLIVRNVNLKDKNTLLQIWDGVNSYLIVTIDEEWRQFQAVVDKDQL